MTAYSTSTPKSGKGSLGLLAQTYLLVDAGVFVVHLLPRFLVLKISSRWRIPQLGR